MWTESILGAGYRGSSLYPQGVSMVW
jgi:hypothetical protein